MTASPCPVWLLDDTRHWHQVTANTLARFPNCPFTGCFTAADLWRGLDLSTGTATWPSILLMDFFLCGERGDAITHALREAALPQALYIVGHSTTRSGSAAIRAAGADTIVIKRETSPGFNHHLADFLDDWLAAGTSA